MMNQKKKYTPGKKLLALLLTLIMTVSLLPVSVFAAEEGAEPDQNIEKSTEPATEADFYKILHLDCGRKYFTKDWIVALLYEMKADGYNQLQLAFGNDGLRFLLDDMSFTANGTTYAHSDVVANVEAGNEAQNSSGDGRWLTQTEMDAIIAKANDLGIQIVPLLNLPGHANAILDIASDAYNATGSNNTLDVANSSAAREFGMAIFQKYVDYFAEKGCEFFNFGADEYANDASGTFSFGRLNSTQYQSFVSFINDMATYISGKGMTPRAFNDGLYYNNQDVTINTDIQCCYWSSGWSGYDVASAATISGKGHAMINTNGDFYYVLGKSDQFDSGYSYASNFRNTSFMGSTISNPVGSMFCIWCDYPNAETETEVAANVRLVLRAMAQRMNNEALNVSEEVVANGFNADGTLNAGGTDTPDTTELSAKDEKTGVDVVVKGLEGQTATVTVTAIAARTEGLPKDAEAVSYNVTPAVDGTAYTGEGTVTLPVPAAWKDSSDRIRGYIVTDGNVETITGTYNADSGKYTFTVQHFSEMGLLLLADSGAGVTNKETINVAVGGTDSRTIDGFNYKDNVDRSKLDETIATVTVEGVDAVEATTTYTQASVTCDTLISSNSNNWTAASGYYYKPDGTNYYPVYAMRSSSWSWLSFSYIYTYTWGYSTDSGSTVTQIGGTQRTRDPSDTPNITVYTQSTTEAFDASTTITFTGVYPGTTYVTVGDTEYQINVAYKRESVSVIVNGNKTVSQTSTIMGEAVVDDPSVVSVSTSGSDVTFTGLKEGTTTVTVGDTIYTVTVSRENLTGKTLNIEYWITNGRPTDTNGDKAYTVNASDVYSADGVALTDLVPKNTTKETRTVQFWRGRLLDKTMNNSSTSGTEEQTDINGDDETYNGVEFTKVRYWSGSWSVYTENNEWVAVEDKHQLVSYYLEILPVSDELKVYAADWGKKADGTTSGDYLDPSSSCTISVIVVYEDGTTNPVSTSAADLASSTIAYGYWTNGRGIGTLNLVAQDGYQIWKIEAETGEESYASTSSTYGNYTVTSFTWDNNPMTVYEGDAVDQYILHNDSNNPSEESYYANLMWDENHEAILIKVYLKAVAQEDSLTVNYFVQGESSTFYSYAINVNAGILFNEGFARVIDATAPGGAKLVNNTVVNSLDVTQTVQSDLSLMTQIGAQYRYSDYQFVDAVRSDDGKTVNLYYTFNSTKTFVVDFGLPLVIKPTDMNDGLTSDKLTVIEINQTTTYANIKTNNDYEIIYTLKQTIDGQDNFGVKYTGTIDTAEGTQSGSVVYSITIIPASTVYYEDSFAKFTGGKGTANGAVWTPDGSASETNQALDELGGDASNVYGYDPAYSNCTTFSMGSAMKVTVTKAMTENWNEGSAWPSAEFTFKGTGFDVISLTNNTSGAIFVDVYEGTVAAGTPVRSYVVDNYYGYTVDKDGNWVVEPDASDTLYQIPVMKITGLDYSEYTAVITVFYDDLFNHDSTSEYDFWLDAIRVYDPMGSDYPDYVEDDEGYPQYIKLRDELANGTADAKVLFIDGGDTAEISVYANYGPNNEVYLANGQAITFKVPNNTSLVSVQIGAKCPSGTAVMNVNSDSLTEISTATEMYYVLNVSGGASVTIANTGSGILSLTNLKLTFNSKPDSVELNDVDTDTQTFVVMKVRALFAAPAEPDPTFTPERFEASWNRSIFRAGQTATLIVKTSEDVEAVTVNGVIIDTYRTLTERTGWGPNAKYVTYREFTYTITAEETTDYIIAAVNEDGVVSETITAALKVRTASQRSSIWDNLFSRWF